MSAFDPGRQVPSYTRLPTEKPVLLGIQAESKATD